MKNVILVTEDDPGLNKLICKRIEQSGHETLSAKTGLEALKLLKGKQIDLLLLDYQLPEMNGHDVIERLKTEGLLIPFIIITGHGDERIAVEMMKQGALDYLIKDTEFLEVFPEKIKKVVKILDTEMKLKESESALIASEKRSKKILDSMNDPVYICSNDYDIQYANPAMLKNREDDFFEKKCYESLFDCKTPCSQCNKFNSIEDHVIHREVVIPKNNNIYQLSSGPINFHKDSVSRLNILRDITELINAKNTAKENEIKLFEKHNLIRTLIDNMPDQIYVKDKESRFVLNSTGHQHELKAASQEELEGKWDFDFFDEEWANEFYQDEQKIIETGVPLVNKEEYKTLRDGSFKWTLTTKVPIRDEQGNITGIAGMNRDITERKLMDDELISSRYELSVRNRIANTFLTVERDKVYHKVLEAILKELNSQFGFLGYFNEEGDLVCPSMTDEVYDKCTIPGKDIVFAKEKWAGLWGRSILEKKSRIVNEDLILPEGHIQLKNALSMPILINSELIGLVTVANKFGGYKNPDKQLLETICTNMAPILSAFLSEDRMLQEKENAFNELKFAKEKAEESDKLKSSFLLNLSHELRTPLNAIMGFSKIISQQYKEDESTARYADLIDSSGKDLIKMVDDTIDMAKLENKQVQLYCKRKDISLTMKEIYSDFKHFYQVNYPDIDFKLKDLTEEIILEADHDKLKEVLSKLLDNAAKFTEKGRVELGCYQNGVKQLMIYVKDTGIGIPVDLQESIFEKFRKIECDGTLYRGSGLGLSISKGLLEIMGGTISLDSKKGKGTKVSISLPVLS